MKKLASELLVERLIEWGVDTVFGLPGDGINGIMEALRRHQDKIRFVLVHHEEAAAFMATGYAKSTGRVGVCLATSGPGGLHLLNGLYDAKLDHAPVLAITGLQGTQQLGTGYQQEVHLERVFEDVAEYNVAIQVPGPIPTLVDLAMKTALAERTVSHITFPVDLQEADPEAVPWHGGLGVARKPDSSPSYRGRTGIPTAAALEQAAAVLNEGERVVLLTGAGAIGAGAQLLQAAELLGAPIVKTLPGKASAPDGHPLVIGGIGLLGTRPAEDAMEECDTLLMVGTNFPYTRFLPAQARVVQIDREPKRIGNRMDVEVALPGDAGSTLDALTPLLKNRPDRRFLARAQEGMQSWRQDMEALEDPARSPIAPQYLMSVVDRLADDDAVLCSDSGTVATWAARHFEIRGGRQFYLSSNLASMACAVPYASAIQLANPGRQCVAFIGDGGFAMLMAEFMTAVRNDLPIKVIVNNNGSLGQILWEQMSLGFPEMGVRFERPMNFAPWATSCGGLGIRVEDPDELAPALLRAFGHPGPALVDVVVNPDEPPMPAKVTYDQARGFVESFLRGQPRRASIASTLFRDKITTLG